MRTVILALAALTFAACAAMVSLARMPEGDLDCHEICEPYICANAYDSSLAMKYPCDAPQQSDRCVCEKE